MKPSEEIIKELTANLHKERFWGDIVRNASVGIAIGYPDGRLGNCNTAYQKITGYSEKELQTIDWNKVLTPPEWEESETAKLQKLHKTKKSVKYEKEYIRKDGSRIPVELVVHPRFDSHGNIECYLAFVIDITERKQAETALKNNEQYLKSIFDSVQDGISVLDPELTVLHVNGVMKKWYAENLPLEGKKCYEVYQNRKNHCDPCPSLRCYKSGKTEFDIVPGLPGSPTEWIELFSYPIKDPNTDEVTKVVEFVRDITKQKKAEDKLKASNMQLQASEQQLRAANQQLDASNQQLQASEQQLKKTNKQLLEQTQELSRMVTVVKDSNDAITIQDFDGNITAWNTGATKMYGYSEQEALKMNVTDLVPEEYKAEAFNFITILKKGELLESLETKRKTKDGKILDVWLVVTKLVNKYGKLIGAATTERDITNQKKAEQLLKTSKQYFKDLTENSSDIILVTSKNGTIKYSSNSMERFIGYKPEELIGQKIFNFVHPADIPRAIIDYGKALLNKEHSTYNSFRIIHKDGTERILEGYGKNLFNNPIIAGFVMNIHDVSERKKAEEKIKESEEKYRTLIESSNDSIFIIIDGKIEYANKELIRLSGFSQEQLIGQDFINFVAPEERKKIINYYQKRVAGKEAPAKYESTAIIKSGKSIAVEVSVIPIKFKGKDAEQVVCRDISKRKESEEELKKRMTELEIFNEAAIGRELKINEHRKEINTLLERLGENPKYDIVV